MPPARGCCGPTFSETGTGHASGTDQLRSGTIATEGETALSIAKSDNCCAGNTSEEEPVAMDTIASSCADACCSSGNSPPTNSSPDTRTGTVRNHDGSSAAEELFCAEITEAGDNNGRVNTCYASDEVEPDKDCAPARADAAQQDGLQASRKKGCCSIEPAAPERSADLNCCVDKPAPCCDTSCLDRMAVRECQQSTNCSGGKGRSCEKHMLSTKEKYASKLQALGCLCRALLALGQESCCAPRQRSSLRRKRCSRKPSLDPRTAMESCRDTDTLVHKPALAVHAKAMNPAQATCSDACCSSVTETQARKPTASSCCDGKTELVTGMSTNQGSTDSESLDVHTSLSGREHIILSISGMTCAGCETNLKRTLGGLVSVSNLKTSLLQSKAEFDLDMSSSTLEAVMKHLERTTEFKCEQVTNQGVSSVDILAPNPSEFINEHEDWPVGVKEMTPVDQKTVNIAFDASIVGARDLVERSWSRPLYLAPPRADPNLGAGAKHVRKVGFTTILSTILTIPVLVMAWAPLPQHELAYGSASLALASLVQFFIAGPFYFKALKALVFSKMIEIDLLIVLSTTAAYVFSVVSFGYLVAGNPLSTGHFFETSTLLVTLIMVGRYLAALARQKAVESISIRALQATTAVLVDTAGDREIDARLLQYSDAFKVLPHCKVVTDGTVISGFSEMDESMVTGESRPVQKYFKSHVIAGSINGSGTLVVRLTRLPGQNTISTIAEMVDQVALSKPKLQELADIVASYFVPVVLFLFIVTLCVWVAVGFTIHGRSGSEAAIQAITYAITVLVVSCPCAVGLAVPMVIVIASGLAAGHGVIIKDSEVIETAYISSHVVFDKTGTLTQGRLAVESEVYINHGWDRDTTQRLLLALLSENKHPVSAAVVSRLQEHGTEAASEVQDIKVLTGKGVEASTSSGLVLRAGNSRWLDSSSSAQAESSFSQGLTTFCFTINGSLVAVFGLQDTLRTDAVTTVKELQDRGIAIHVLSGDDDAAVRVLTNRLDIPESHVRSRCTPTDKKDYIEALQQPGSPGAAKPIVIFCGDGTNDAVALAQANVGVHMSGGTSGTDVAKSAATVVLMRPDLAGVLTLINISRKSVRRMWFNFGWSAVYNVFAVLLAGGAFVTVRGGEGVRIPPAFAGLGELVSVLPVVVAAVLMRWERV